VLAGRADLDQRAKTEYAAAGIREVAERLYTDLREAGLDVLLDDRRENPGVKFNDADLMGVPVRLDIGERSLRKNVVEFKLRHEAERVEIPVGEAVQHVVEAVEKLRAEIRSRVRPVDYVE